MTVDGQAPFEDSGYDPEVELIKQNSNEAPDAYRNGVPVGYSDGHDAGCDGPLLSTTPCPNCGTYQFGEPHVSKTKSMKELADKMAAEGRTIYVSIEHPDGRIETTTHSPTTKEN